MDMGYNLNDFLGAGFSAAEFRAINLGAAMAQLAGCTDSDMLRAGYHKVEVDRLLKRPHMPVPNRGQRRVKSGDAAHV